LKTPGDSSIESDAQLASACGTRTAIFACSGEYWTVGYSGTTSSLKDIKGLSYIQRLLRHPGEKFHALDLLNEPGTAANLDLAAGDLGSLIKDGSVSVGGLGDAGEMLDTQAKQNYKRRLLELKEELAEFEERGDLQRAEKTQSEIDFLAREIGRAVGLGGRSRHSGSAAERARLNVTRAIKAALLKVSERSADLGAMLDRSIRTGFFCSYIPDARNSESWQFSLEGPEDVRNGELKPVGVPNGELTNHDNGQQSSNGKSLDFPLLLPVSEENQPRRGRYGLAGLLSAAGLALVAAAMIAVPHLSRRAPQPSASRTSAGPAPRLPNKPSIAVLPFINLSGDREQEYFSDGVTGDLITDLSRVPGLFVIARTSSFTYKGKSAKLQDVGNELGVKYVLEGSVRKAGDQVRITAQLADASTGAEIWAERYDRPLRGVFVVQDEIVRRIMTTLNLQLDLAGRGIVVPRSTENFDAYDDLLRGLAYQLTFTREGNLKARQMLEKAIELDPKYAAAYAILGQNYWLGWALLFNTDLDVPDRVLHLEQQAIALDDSLSIAHSVLAEIYGLNGHPAQALAEAQRAIVLDPNSASAYFLLADVLTNQSRPAEALAAIQKARRIDPRRRDDYLLPEGLAYLQLGRWKEGISILRPYSVRYPDVVWAHVWLAGAYNGFGDHATALAEAAEVERIVALNPNSAPSYLALAFSMNFTSRPKNALLAVENAMNLDPHNREEYLLAQGAAYVRLGRWKEAVSALKGYLARYPTDVWCHLNLAVAYIELGQDNAARAEVAQVQRLNPEFSLKMIRATDDTSRRIVADVSKAGLR
jgi:TolB-like protein/tetratricopeptide (TPR) repeat protein